MEIYLDKMVNRCPFWLEVPKGTVTCPNCKGYKVTFHIDEGNKYQKSCTVCKGEGYITKNKKKAK